ncbi:MAG: carotenoid oxygenase family protein [Myxococcaceae bacterium]|nr:carotenoid oxygenase family protein [Myxococcaceae bacterium]
MATDNGYEYLQGEHQPVTQELDVAKLEVTGALPKELDGLYVRNSPNPHFQPPGKYHWFDGDGMVHGLRFGDGQARYVNRWIRTKGFLHEEQLGKAVYGGILDPLTPEAMKLPGGPLKDTANTDLVFHRGKLLALWWLSGTPYSLSPKDLSTLGPETFGGKLTGGFSAHPKVDPRTNELVFFDYSIMRPPFLRYGVVNAQGELVKYEVIETPTPHILHDMAITEHYSVLLDLPLGWDKERLKQGKRKIGFDRETPSRLGVIPRHGSAKDVRWFEAEPCYCYHTINAYELGDEVVLVACRVKDPIPAKRTDTEKMARLDTIEFVPHLYEWRMNLKTGKLTERQLDDAVTEFPRVNDTRQGQRLRYSYNPVVAPRAALAFEGFIKYDLLEGKQSRWTVPAGWWAGEASFAPRPGARDEDDGWLVTFATNPGTQKSACFVLDAKAPEAGPIATIALPQRIPLGFHSTWCPGA